MRYEMDEEQQPRDAVWYLCQPITPCCVIAIQNQHHVGVSTLGFFCHADLAYATQVVAHSVKRTTSSKYRLEYAHVSTSDIHHFTSSTDPRLLFHAASVRLHHAATDYLYCPGCPGCPPGGGGPCPGGPIAYPCGCCP